MECDFQQCGILNFVDSDEPVLSLFKLRNSKLCSTGSLRVEEHSNNYGPTSRIPEAAVIPIVPNLLQCLKKVEGLTKMGSANLK